MEFCSGKPDNPAASVMDYCTGVLMENLGVRPGAVTPLAMINGAGTGVQLFIDSGLKSCQQIYVHPLVNDRTLGITLEGLQAFFEKIKVDPVWVDLE